MLLSKGLKVSSMIPLLGSLSFKVFSLEVFFLYNFPDKL
jgi:hypothetical protein